MLKAISTGLVLGLATNACIAQEPTGIASSFEGQWTVTDVVGYSDVSGGIPEAKMLLGKTLRISADEIEFAGQRCRPHGGFVARSVETAPKLKDYYGINREDTGLPQTTLLLDSPNCTPVFRVDQHRIVFGQDGVILRAIRP